MAYLPIPNQSVSGTVGASVIGAVPVTGFPANQSISGTVVVNNGSVVAFQGTNPWIVTGSVQTTVTTGNSSVQLLAGSAVIGSVAVLQGTNPFIITGSVQSTAAPNQSVSGTVTTQQSGTVVTSLVSTVPSSVIVGTSIFGQLPAGTAPLGSVATLQGTNPWNIAGSVAAFVVGNASIITLNQGSSILSVPVGSTITVLQGPSIVGTYAEDAASANADKGLFVLGVRNDTTASLVSADGDYGAFSSDSAGRTLVKPFAADENRLDTSTSIVSTSITALFPSVTGLRNYITDVMVANTGGSTTLITFKDGSTSILGYTIAPSGGGSNINGLAFPMRTATAQDFVFQPAVATSVLYITVKGYKAP